MNFLLDSTIGLVFIYVMLLLMAYVVKCCNLKDLRNGEYGQLFLSS